VLKSSGDALWAVSLTVPSEIEPDGVTTWDKIEPTLSFPAEQ
jgi:hypothetical protein